ncbi:MAG TPA: iron ABC transporter permease [Candidatus Pacearchaeota archaeon]|nr:iron ABC transporter permease [Candidatus Pacearchaeota archaeon]
MTTKVSQKIPAPRRKKMSNGMIVAVLAAALVLLFFLSLCIGRYGIPPGQLLEIIAANFGGTPLGGTAETVIFYVRLPRILAAVMIGAALAVSGAAYQGLFRNPMVSPDILGASAGAGFGAALAILLSFDSWGIQISAFLFSLAAVTITYLTATVIGRKNDAVLTMILVGIVISSLFSSLISIAKYAADTDDKLPAITFWLMGSLSSASIGDAKILALALIIGAIPIFLLRWKLNIMSFGDEEARNMGVDVNRIRPLIIAGASLLTAAAVSTGGMIGWVGLIIPHIARFLVGPNYKILLPVSLICGSLFLLAIDNVARNAFAAEIPLGILTSLIGAPFFIFLLWRGKKSWV